MQFLLTIISVIYIICRIIYVFIKSFNEGRERMRQARLKNKQMINTIEQGLKNNNNKLFYEVKGYKNDKSLKQFVNFILPQGSDYKVVNKELDYYFFTNRIKYPLVKYFGKKKKYKNTIVIADMGQMYLERIISKIFGEPVKMERIDVCP